MNELIFYFFYNFSHQSSILDRSIIFFADTFPYVLVFATGVFFVIYRKSWRELAIVFLSSFTAYFISWALKILFHTDRPFLVLGDVQALFFVDGYAFPSGHAAFFGALATAVFLINKRVGYIAILFTLLIGIGRIAAGVHFPVDILGGFVIGVTASYLVAYFTKNV